MLEAVQKTYRRRKVSVTVLRDVNLEVTGGEMVCITGRSGVGKTTLLQLVAGLDRATGGTVKVAGRDLGELGDRDLAAHRAQLVGFVFQSFNLLEHLTVGENVMLPAAFRRSGRTRAWRRALEALEWVGLAGRAEGLPSQLSGGERQRVALARAAFARPALLICDEVTGNLDRETGGEVARLIHWLCRDEGTAVLAATHDPVLVRGSDRVLKLAQGRLGLVDPGEIS
jgi:putative ABC transport system ATP-binding protein